MLLALAVAPAVAYAQVAYEFDLPSQPLADTLRAIGTKAGVNVVFDPTAVRGKIAAAIKGRLSAQEAVRRALDGAGLSYRSTTAGSLVVEAPVPRPPSSDAPSQVNELIVTATKRRESIQRAALSITAFSEKALNENGVTGLQDYAAQSPNLAIAYTGFLGATGQRITIRGIYGANTTGVYIDDTPLPESVDPRVLDLNRIEVLRGPQGTLYGARSEGGTVRLITNQPDTTGFHASIHAVGSRTDSGGGDNGSIDGVVNAPLIKDKVALRVNAYDSSDSGFLTRAPSPEAPVDFAVQKHLGSSQSRGVSVALQASLFDDKLVITPRFLTETTHDTNHLWTDITPENFTQYRLFNINEPGGDNLHLYSLTAQYSTSVGDFISSTSQFVRHAYDTEDDSEYASYALGTPPAPFIFRTLGEEKDFSEEFRFVSNLKGPLQFTTGVFYQDSKIYSYQPATTYSIFGSVISDVYDEHFHTSVDEIAVFGEVSYAITARLKVTAGGRYFDNRVDFNGEEGGIATSPDPTIVPGRQKETGFNPKVAAQYQIDNDHMVYASAAKGFRIGGVNVIPAAFCASDLSALHLSPADIANYKSDSVWSYELGSKNAFFNRALTVDGSVFDIEWSNVQQNSVLPNCGFGFTTNSGKARSRGGELELKARLPRGFDLTLGGGYTDARITDAGQLDLVPVGTRVQQVPQWTLASGLDSHYKIGSLPGFSRLEADYTGDSLSATNNIASPRVRKAYTLVKIRTGVTVRGVELTVFVDNLTNTRANFSDIRPEAGELPGRPRIAVNRPRTVGVDLRYKF